MENILDSVISQHKIGKCDLRKKSLPLYIVNKYFKHIPPFCWKQIRGLVDLGRGGCVPGREGYTAHFQQYMQGEAEGLSSSPALVDKLFFVPDEHQTIAVRFISVLVKAFYRVRGTLSKQLL